MNCIYQGTKEYEEAFAEITGANKPPIGIMPERIWLEHRQEELKSAIKRYLDANLKVPDEWVCEYNKHLIFFDFEEVETE